MTDYASAILRRGSAVLVRRDESLRLPTTAVDAPDAEDEPVASARRALREQFGVADGVGHVRTGSPVQRGEDAYYPVLFEIDSTASLPNLPADAEWLSPTALLHEESDAGAWRQYERVAPTVRSIAADDERGAASLSVRALEVLRDRAALQVAEERSSSSPDSASPQATEAQDASSPDSQARRDTDEQSSSTPDSVSSRQDAEGESDWDELSDLGTRLLRARPSMAVLENRVNRVLAAAHSPSSDTQERDAAADESVALAVEAAADAGIDRALAADRDAADRAASVVEDRRVLTLSRSGTVLEALTAASPRAVFVAESRPAREGVGVAETLADRLDAPVTVHADAAVAHVLATEAVDAVVVGADAVLPDGRVVNKTGTRAAALAAAREDVPVYAVAAGDKITHRETVNLETGDATAVYDGDADVDVLNPTFDVTPGDLVEAVVTERGNLDSDAVATVAEEHETLTEWRD